MRTRFLVLLGLPGAGKSTVGPLVAERLGWRFVDLDRRIELEAGTTIAAIFAREGEAGFRERERRATREVGRETDTGVVLAPGGGWIEDRANFDALGAMVRSVYLRVSVDVALARIGASKEVRPLLGGADPGARLRELLARREPLYLRADHTVSVESMSQAEVATSIVALASGSEGE